jgi:hypothetical protein
MLIKYLPGYRKQDSIHGVGLWWEPGQVRNVSPEVAEKLCAYTDTWEKAEESAVGAVDAPEIGLNEAGKPVEEPVPVIDFHAMNKDALIKFAETKYNEKISKRLSENTIRHKVIDLFSKNEMDG